MIKNKRQVFIILLFIMFFYSADFALALEINYPQIPGLPKITDNSGFPDYVGYFFTLGTYLAGALALMSFAVGAVQMIMSAGNPTTAGDAKGRMMGSILGLVLTISAFLILKTINPTLIIPTLTPLPGVAGVFYTNGTDFKPAPQAGNASEVPAGYGKLIYKCEEMSLPPPLLVWTYPKPGQQDDENFSNSRATRVNCDGTADVSSGSFKAGYETPGVYYFMASGYMSEANTSTGQIPAPFKGKVKSIRIINDPTSDIFYGAVFHDSEKPTQGGNCVFVMTENKEGAANIPVSDSVDIFLWNAKHPETSGDGIQFYSEPFGWNSVASAGRCFLDQKNQSNNNTKECKKLGLINNFYYNKKVTDLVFDYTNVNQPMEYQDEFKNFQEAPGSVRINGNYLLILGYYKSGNLGTATENNSQQTIFCQTYYKDIGNGNDQIDFVAQNNIINIVSVIPLK